MAEKVIVSDTVSKVIVKEQKNNLIVSAPGPQGPRGKTILNGSGLPANNLGLQGDFYYNILDNAFHGPKLTDGSWDGAIIIQLANAESLGRAINWSIGQVQQALDGSHYVEITHDLGFYPNVTVKTSAGDVLETGIDYNNINKITLTMAQPFAGTAYLS